MSLGFFDAERKEFQIHSVTGPDEYNTVVNNNLYTNVMAQYNLDAAADALDGTTTTDRPARPAPRSLIGGALDTDRGAGITIGQPRRRRRD